MNKKRVVLYEKLPEIYRTKDEEQLPPGQLKNYLALAENIFEEIHKNIESLYENFFIETCDNWVIPYIGDLLGTSHLTGKPWTQRVDVADTITLRRRKGTLACIERLTYNLTQWGTHCVELRENLVWNQHLNHQRPDAGGDPPYSLQSVNQFLPIRGGTAALRDSAMLSLLNTPFDPFAHIPDLKPMAPGNIRYNIPNLAIFLWGLKDYRIRISKPGTAKVNATGTTITSEASYIARFDIHPLGEPIRLFNTYQFNPEREPPIVTQIDETPSPIPLARLTEGSAAGNPEKYISVDIYTLNDTNIGSHDISNVGLQLHLPDPPFTDETWPKNPLCSVELKFQTELDNSIISPSLKALLDDNGISLSNTATVHGENPIWLIIDQNKTKIIIKKKENHLNIYTKTWLIRGANLCAWEDGVQPPIRDREIIIDPLIGRIAIGVRKNNEAKALKDGLLLTYTYGAVGPVGAHPISRIPTPQKWNGKPVDIKDINLHNDPSFLITKALENIQNSDKPIVIVIHDSMTHKLDLNAINGTIDEDGGPNLLLNKSLIIRAADHQRPIIRLKQPLRFRPADVACASDLTVRLEGLYLTRDASFPVGEPLIARAAIHSLEIKDCTLNPGGYKKLDGTRAIIHKSLKLREPYGFAVSDEEIIFDQTPEITMQRTVAGPLLINTGYLLFLIDSIIDAGKGVGDDVGDDLEKDFAVSNATDPKNGWGPPTQVKGITAFGRMRVESINGRGGIWIRALEVLNNQKGCLRFSYFSGNGDRLPQNLGCVYGTEAELRFVSEFFGQPAYGQLYHTTDFRILERGPNDDAMGAFGFLLEAHKWRNLKIRYREFMPVGIKPILIPIS